MTGIRPDLWAALEAQTQAEGTTVRAVLLSQVASWLDLAPARARARALVPALRVEVARRQRRRAH